VAIADADSPCASDAELALVGQAEDMDGQLDPRDIALADALYEEDMAERGDAGIAAMGDASATDGRPHLMAYGRTENGFDRCVNDTTSTEVMKKDEQAKARAGDAALARSLAAATL
jgi:hypothetical protein